MPDRTAQSRAVERLQQLGLREYEAKCYVALSTISSGTAREISERTDVPRTRIYEATRMLESEGLIEIQHSSPKEFRAVPVEEAVEILRRRYTDRIEELESDLDSLGTEGGDDRPIDQEIWALSDRDAIATRTVRLIREADGEVLLLIADARAISDDLIDALTVAGDRGIRVVVGAATPALEAQLADALPRATVFESDLEWLGDEPTAVAPTDESLANVGRLLMVDREAILASSFTPGGNGDGEHAIYGGGFGNSLVVIMRRLLATGLPTGGPGDGGAGAAAVEEGVDEGAGAGAGAAAGSEGRE